MEDINSKGPVLPPLSFQAEMVGNCPTRTKRNTLELLHISTRELCSERMVREDRLPPTTLSARSQVSRDQTDSDGKASPKKLELVKKKKEYKSIIHAPNYCQEL